MKKKILATVLPLALAAAYGSNAVAQEVQPSTAQSGAPTSSPDTAPQDASSNPASTDNAAAVPVASNTVTITGFRSSLQKALNLKQQAIGVRDSIVAEDIGKFPEANVAESLQRVPGVILNRDESSG